MMMKIFKSGVNQTPLCTTSLIAPTSRDQVRMTTQDDVDLQTYTERLLLTAKDLLFTLQAITLGYSQQ